MDKIISLAVELGLWRELDIQFAYMLSSKSFYHPAFILAVIALSVNCSDGHVCLPLNQLTPNGLFHGQYMILAEAAYKKSGSFSVDHWEEFLLSNSSVSDGTRCTPLILEKQKLYLNRMWNNECIVANFFRSVSKDIINFSENKYCDIMKLLNDFFPIDIYEVNIINWQKVACVISLITQLLVMSGGPGTGKTATASKLLEIILLLYIDVPLIIKIAAPTGKAAIRLNQSIGSIINHLNLICPNNRHILSSIQAVTLHRLLFSTYSSQYNIQKKTLPVDVLIIDESSMIDLSMMARIIDILPDTVKVILLGDHKQLFSIHPGSVFSDICNFIGYGYTEQFCQILNKMTSYTLPVNKINTCSIINNLCLLDKNYRFSSESGIGKLANAISLGDSYYVLSLLSSNQNTDLQYTIVKKNEDYHTMIVQCSITYYNFLKKIHFCSKNAKYILNVFDQYRLLCALREGPFGVSVLNILIEKLLNNYGVIHLKNNNLNYIGRPIIITANAPSLSLFNGEFGILLPDYYNNQGLSAYFLLPNGEVRSIPIWKLPKYESSFVMTVHKSQGSEFQHVVLILPNKILPILTRELLYTGVSRAYKKLSIYASNRVIQYSVNNPTKRWSGLVDKLK